MTHDELAALPHAELVRRLPRRAGGTVMNGQHLVFYREHMSGRGFVWRCILRQTFQHTYSRPSDWLRNAEAQMRGDRSNVLWRKNDEDARRLIWC